MSGKTKVVYLLEEETVPTLDHALLSIHLLRSFCDNLLRLLEAEMYEERVRRNVLVHGIKHLKRLGTSVNRYLDSQRQ